MCCLKEPDVIENTEPEKKENARGRRHQHHPLDLMPALPQRFVKARNKGQLVRLQFLNVKDAVVVWQTSEWCCGTRPMLEIIMPRCRLVAEVGQLDRPGHHHDKVFLETRRLSKGMFDFDLSWRRRRYVARLR